MQHPAQVGVRFRILGSSSAVRRSAGKGVFSLAQQRDAEDLPQHSHVWVTREQCAGPSLRLGESRLLDE